MSLNGSSDGPPTKAGTWICDDLAGLHGAIGALPALRHHAETGEGQHLDVSLLDSVLFQSDGFPTLAAMGYPLTRLGSEVGQAVPVNSFACRDGHLYLAIILDAHWAILCNLMQRPELATAAGFRTVVERVNNRTVVNGVVAGWCATQTRDDAIAAIAAAGLTVARINTYADAVADPHIAEREALQPTTLEDGSVAPLVAPPAKFSRTPTRVRFAAAALGAHTQQVLGELGDTIDQIATLHEANAL